MWNLKKMKQASLKDSDSQIQKQTSGYWWGGGGGRGQDGVGVGFPGCPVVKIALSKQWMWI